MENQYWVYILKCSDNSYYTGSTSNLERRISEHQLGIFPGYTSKRLPIKLVYSCYFDNPNDSIAAERQIKGWSRSKKEALIKGDFKLLHKLSECKNESHSDNFRN